MEKMNVVEDVFVSVSDYRGKKYVSIRKWYETKEGELAPGKNGLNVEADVWAVIVAKFGEIKEFVEKELK